MRGLQVAFQSTKVSSRSAKVFHYRIIQFIHTCTTLCNRFTNTVPPATAPAISLVCHHPSPSHVLRETELVQCITKQLPSTAGILHCSATASLLQFPETRLIQYDCGESISHYITGHPID